MDGNRLPDGGNRLRRLGNVLYGADAEVAEWVGRAIPGYIRSPDAKALGIIRDGRIVAGAVFERFNGVHCEVTITARPGVAWADRRTLFALYHYVFVQLDCLALSAVIPASNLPSLNLCTKLGFQPVAYVRFAAPDGGPLVILQQERDSCRWLSYGQKQQSTGGTGSLRDSKR